MDTDLTNQCYIIDHNEQSIQKMKRKQNRGRAIQNRQTENRRGRALPNVRGEVGVPNEEAVLESSSV